MVRPRRHSDQEILETARRVFVEDGPQASTETIAEALGLSAPALFKRFGSKRELMIAALLPDDPQWFARAEAGPMPGSLEGQLSSLGREVFSFYTDLIPRVMSLHSAGFDLAAHLGEQRIPPPVRALALMQAWFEQAKEQGRLSTHADPSALAAAFLGGLHMRACAEHLAASSGTARPQDSLGDGAYVDRLVRTLLAAFTGSAPVLEASA